MRVQRYGSLRTNQNAAPSAGGSTTARWASFTRPARSMVTAQKPINAAVPKSSMTTSRQNTPTGTTVGTNPKKNRFKSTGGLASHHARKITTAHLASSDGWIWIGPRRIHRRAPLTSLPTPGMRTATHVAAAAAVSHTTGDFQNDDVRRARLA